jgi:hypothetical protein
MTAIVYSKNTLYVDSRRTRGVTHHDTAVKLIQITGITYQGEEVLGWAAAGNVALHNKMLDNFLEGPDGFLDIYKAAAKSGIGLGVAGHASAIFVTTKAAYKIRLSSIGRANITIIKDAMDGIGNGAETALQMMHLFDVPGPLAVATASISRGRVDSGCGGLVVEMSFEGGVAGEPKSTSFSSTKDVHTQLVKHISSKACKYTGKYANMLVGLRKGTPEHTKPAVRKKAVAKKTSVQRVIKTAERVERKGTRKKS